MTRAYLWLMVAVWSLHLVLAWRMKEPAGIRATAAVLLVGACLCLLAGCGGGDFEERAEVGPPDCKARPELCA
jgi:hypothetical protein